MAEKKKGRRAYLNDFKTTLSGEYIYTGATYSPEGDYKGTKTALVIIALVTTALSIFCGVVPAEPMLNTFYVIIPFVVSLAAAVRLLWAVVRLLINKLPLREYVLHQTYEKLLPAATVMAIASGVTIAGLVVFITIKGLSDLSLWTYSFAFAQISVVIFGLFARKITQRVKWKKL